MKTHEFMPFIQLYKNVGTYTVSLDNTSYKELEILEVYYIEQLNSEVDENLQNYFSERLKEIRAKKDLLYHIVKNEINKRS